MVITTIALQSLLALVFIITGGAKLIGIEILQVGHFDRYPPWFRRVTGAVEITGAVGMVAGVWVPEVAIIAGFWLAAAMINLVYINLSGSSSRSPLRVVTPSVLLLLVAAVAVLHLDDLGQTPSTPQSTASAATGTSTSQQELIAIQAGLDLSVGNNRFAFVLLQPDGTELADAAVDLQLYALESNTTQLKGGARAAYQRMATEIPHVHLDGEIHLHQDVRGVYVVPDLQLDRAGRWGVVIRAISPDDARPLTANLAFQVNEHGFTPAVGAPAPVSSTPTATSPEELRAICTRDPPDNMHHISVDAALVAGRPFVLVFATPRFCQSRICGPVTELVFSLHGEYRERMDFIHVEPFDLDLIETEGRLELVEAARQWGLVTEPWVFVMNAQGRVAAKFEGIVGREELSQAIEQVLS